MTAADRAAVERIVRDVGNFNEAEVACAMELVDIYLQDGRQEDYRIFVAECEGEGVCGYACYGPTPLTRGTYDLYWIATRPDCQGKGVGRVLVSSVEERIRGEGGRLLIIETSSKETYGCTIEFYRRLGYHEASRISDFYDLGDDKLTFVKRLPSKGREVDDGTVDA